VSSEEEYAVGTHLGGVVRRLEAFVGHRSIVEAGVVRRIGCATELVGCVEGA
jgi:energy-converting hydrogenase Eha subunit B